MVRSKQTRIRSFLPVIIAVCILAAIGSTIAFLSDSVPFANLFHVASDEADFTEDFTPPSDWQPCQEVDKTATATNKNSTPRYVRMRINEYWRIANTTTDVNDHYTTDLSLTWTDATGTHNYAIINYQNENDWELRSDGWYYYKTPLRENETTTSLLKSVTMNCDANLAGSVVYSADGKTGESIPSEYADAEYHVYVTFQMTDTENDFPADKRCTITINPNGGTFNGSVETYTETTTCGTNIVLTSIAPASNTYELADWTKIVTIADESTTSTLPASSSSYLLIADTELTANWLSTIFHNVTVDPNGGVYDESASPSTYSIREGSTFTIGEATLSGYYVNYWSVTSGSAVIDNNNSFVVAEDTEIAAHWDRAVARIERTGRIYNSIMAAENAAQTNDTITLLVDTEETVTNSKTVTLDLNGHTVTGSLTNTTAGNLTIINGEINNPNGAAVTNNGILTLGIDDYDETTGVANVINDNVRLIGTTAGLYQDNNTYKLYYYDGYLEGDLGLVGGYDGAPFYRTMSEDYEEVTIYFFPNVEHMEADGRSYQHVELKSSNRAVSKTSHHGDIYYYNLQDNINTSAITGYKIYAVRDFDASYPITINSNDEIELDLVNYTINFGETMTNNGTLEICASAEEPGSAVFSQTIINNSNLTFCNTTASAANSTTLIENRGALNLDNATLSSSYGRVLTIPVNGTTLNMDSDSYISSNESEAIYNYSTDLVISDGHVTSARYGVYNHNSNATVTVEGGEVVVSNSTQYTSAAIRQGKVIVNGGEIGLITPNKSSTYAIYTDNATINDGRVYSLNSYETIDSTVVINGGLIEGINTNNYYLDVVHYSRITMNGGTVRAVTKNNRAVALSPMVYPAYINGGTIEAYSESGTAVAVYTYYDEYPISIYNATITAESESGTAYGVETRDGYTNVYSGTITADTTSGTAYGMSGTTQSIYGGIVTGKTAGVNGGNTYIGSNDDTIHTDSPIVQGGQYAITNTNARFFDGILKGNTNAYNGNIITAVPDGAILHLETIDGVENCWLVEDDPYLEANGVQYNSLTKAYNATASGGTITVIRDFSTSASLPANPSGKEITIDLNGHTVNYTQSLTNNGTLNIVDNSTNHDGVIINNTNPVIVNNATLNLTSGTLQSNSRVINGGSNSVTNIAGGKVFINPTSGSEMKAIYRGKTVNVSGGEVICESTGSASCYTVDSVDYINVSNTGKITAKTTSNRAVAISWNYNNINITGGTVEASSISSTAYTMYLYLGNVSINGGSVIAHSDTSETIGLSSQHGTIVIDSGTVSASSTSGSAYGINTSSSYSTTINGGSVSATSGSSSTGVYVYHGSASVTGGTVTGGTNGIANGNDATIYVSNSAVVSGGVNGISSSRNTIIGTNDATIYTTAPEVTGGQYAVSGGSISFYDGILKGGTKAYPSPDNIVAIPDGALVHTEIIDGVENSWLLEDDPYLEANGTQYNSLTKAYNATASGDTITVIKDFTTSAALPANPSGKTIIIDLNGHTINYTQSITNNGTMEIRDDSTDHNGIIINNTNATIQNAGTLTISSGTIQGNTRAINHSGSSAGTVNINGGKVTAIPSGSNESSAIYYGNTINITDGEVSCISTGSAACKTIENASYVNLSGTGKIYTSTNSGSANGVYFIYNQTNITGGTIESESISGSATGVADFISRTTLNGGTIIARTNTNTAEGIYSQGEPITVNSGSIIASSINGNAYGISISFSSGVLNITGGDITASSNNGTSKGISMSNNSSTTITGGTVTGGTTGINADNSSISIRDNVTITGGADGINSNSNVYLGTNDSTISSTNPAIIGGRYALNGGNVYFYDGILKGGTAPYNGRIVKDIPDTTKIGTGTETIDGVTYTTNFLTTASDVAQIGATKFGSIYSAISASNPGDTIELIDTNYIYRPLSIPSTANITIDLNGNDLIANNYISNSGTLTITDSQNSNHYLDYNGDDYFFQNATGGNLTLDGLTIDSYKNVSNSGSLTITDTKLLATSTSLLNNGSATISGSQRISSSEANTIDERGTMLTISNSTIYASDYKDAIYQNNSSSSTTTITNSTINGSITIGYGTAAIDQSTITKQNREYQTDNLITSSKPLTITNSDLTLILNNPLGSDYTSVIKNTSTLNISDSNITCDYISSSVSANVSTINNSGNATYTNTNITASPAPTNDYNSYPSTYGVYNTGTFNYVSGDILVDRKNNSYAFYNNGGTATILSGNLKATGGNAYGIYVNGGTVTLGEAEPDSSPDYGQATAHVSTTDPHVEGVGSTTGIGVKLASGYFNFYDGYLLGSTNAKPDTASNVEYQYEAITGTDSNTGYEYSILTYMPN